MPIICLNWCLNLFWKAMMKLHQGLTFQDGLQVQSFNLVVFRPLIVRVARMRGNAINAVFGLRPAF